MESPRNKQSISFKSCAVLRVMVESLVTLLCPTHDVNHPSVPNILLDSHLVAIMVIRPSHDIAVPVFKSLLFYLILTPKHKSSDAGNSNILLLCLIYKFVIGIMYRKKHSIHRVQVEVLRHSGVWNISVEGSVRSTPLLGSGTYLYRVQSEVLPTQGLEHICIGFG